MTTTEPHVITTSTGTGIRLERRDDDVLVICDHPDAPADMRNHPSGRVIDGAYQPPIFAAFGLRPEALRAIADLIDETEVSR